MSRRKNTAILAGTNAFTSLTSLLLASFCSYQLSKQDYATYRQAILAYTFVAPILALGLPAALVYFIPADRERARTYLLNVITPILVLGSLFSLFCLTIGPQWLSQRFNNPALEPIIPWIALFGMGTLMAGCLSTCLTACRRFQLISIFTAVSRLCVLLIVVAAVWIFRNPASAVVSQAITVFLIGLAAIILMWKVTGNSQRGPARLELPLVKKISFFAIPLGIATLLEGLALGTGKILVASMCTPEEFAIYVNGAVEIPFIGMITGAMTAAALPEIVAHYKQGEKGKAHLIWNAIARECSLILLPLGGLLFVAAPLLIHLLFSSDFKDSVTPFRILLLLLPARIVFFGVIFQAAGRTDIIFYRSFFTLLLNAGLTYFLVRWLGHNGAAWGTVTVVLGYVVPVCIYYSRELLGVKFVDLLPWAMISSTIAAVSASMLASWLCISQLPMESLPMKTCIQVFIYLLLCGGFLFRRFARSSAYHEFLKKIKAKNP